MVYLEISFALPCDRAVGRQTSDPLTLDYLPIFPDDTPQTDEVWRVNADATILRRGDEIHVFRAQLLRPNHGPTDVALKIDHSGKRTGAFLDEATAYTKLVAAFQGTIVPRFFGCFQTTLSNTTISCIITEYCGEPLHTNLPESPPELKAQLINVVEQIHRAGVAHGDLQEANILLKDGKLKLIDWEKASSHSCDRQLRLLQGAIVPTPEEFGRNELYETFCEMGLWSASTTPFMGVNIDNNPSGRLKSLDITYRPTCTSIRHGRK
ncbi:kinase-like domain-containing protein [Mycena metata]|uniref:non-specific serine/threonine protein kinase n=1 Tax=Mycena metata TaxID=1033252 RepID=A0AAD7P223_9AGAR|nr:kinase-like domain-containing protein [Mycena metata]